MTQIQTKIVNQVSTQNGTRDKKIQTQQRRRKQYKIAKSSYSASDSLIGTGTQTQTQLTHIARWQK